MRPLPHETTAPYLHRLAHAYQATTTDLLDALGITTTRPRSGASNAGTVEIRLNTAALQRLAALAHRPRPGPAESDLPPPPGHHSPTIRPVAGQAPAPDAAATATWQSLQPGHRAGSTPPMARPPSPRQATRWIMGPPTVCARTTSGSSRQTAPPDRRQPPATDRAEEPLIGSGVPAR
ncbi:hypothetical protein [Kitasatospora nipponensis]|uniref:hypothetical protein n=1 Tax=Kitasatospora nipponensis TaxID=258049 RepID=UPI0031D75D76